MEQSQDQFIKQSNQEASQNDKSQPILQDQQSNNENSKDLENIVSRKVVEGKEKNVLANDINDLKENLKAQTENQSFNQKADNQFFSQPINQYGNLVQSNDKNDQVLFLFQKTKLENDILANSSGISQRERLQLIKQKRIQEQQNYQNFLNQLNPDTNCTFKPELNNIYNSSHVLFEEEIYERNKKWQQRVQNHIVSSRIQQQSQPIPECTFTPKICSKSKVIIQNNFDPSKSDSLYRTKNGSNYALHHGQSIVSYIDRQATTRKIKEQVKTLFPSFSDQVIENLSIQSINFKLQQKNQIVYPHITIPHNFKFSHMIQVNSLKTPTQSFCPQEQGTRKYIKTFSPTLDDQYVQKNQQRLYETQNFLTVQENFIRMQQQSVQELQKFDFDAKVQQLHRYMHQ